MPKDSKTSLLGRLKSVVNKVRFLMNFNLNRWRLASAIGASASSTKRWLSFNDRSGLGLAIINDHENSSHSGSSRELVRSVSLNPSEDQDDVDKRAEMFIANFYRQLRIERQVSLELRYCRDNSFGSKNSVSP